VIETSDVLLSTGFWGGAVTKTYQTIGGGGGMSTVIYSTAF